MWMTNERKLTRESSDAIFPTQGFALTVCVDFNNLYFIFSVRIGIPELFIYWSKVLSMLASVQEGGEWNGQEQRFKGEDSRPSLV